METTEQKAWVDGDEILGVALSCHNGYKSLGVRKYERVGFDVIKIGSAADCHLRDPCLASCHALLELREREVMVRVVDNVSGVRKNGQRVYGEGKVLDRDSLSMGDFKIEVTMVSTPGSGPYHHKRMMISVIDEFKRCYPNNKEIIKIEELVRFDNGQDRDVRHTNMLKQLVHSIREFRNFQEATRRAAEGKTETLDTLYKRYGDLRRDEGRARAEFADERAQVAGMARQIVASGVLDGLSKTELVQEALRLAARTTTGGRIAEMLADLAEDDEFEYQANELLMANQGNLKQDLAAFFAAMYLLKKTKEEGQ